MPVSTAYFLGGPCDGKGVNLTITGKPPATLVCRGTTYYYNPNARGTLAYVTKAYQEQYDASRATKDSRDVFRAWHGLMRTLLHSQQKHHRTMAAASKRLRRAVR